MVPLPWLMCMMLPWFIGQIFCLIGEGIYIGVSASVTAEASIINYVMGFFVPEERGLFNTMSAVAELFTEALPRVLMWDYSFFSGDYEIVRYFFLIVFSVPLVIGFIIALAQLAMGVFRRS